MRYKIARVYLILSSEWQVNQGVNIMSNVLGGGAKFHLMGYRGAKVTDSKVSLRISAEGRTSKACGGRYKGQLNAIEFSSYRKGHRAEWLCQKCVVAFDRLMAEAKELKGNK